MKSAFRAVKLSLSRRGMALVSVLLVTVVLLGLAGAFFVAHKSDLALMVSGGYREQTKNACLSLADFVQYKLQNDRKFGLAPFPLEDPEATPEAFPAGADEPLLLVSYYGVKATGSPTAPVRNFMKGTMPESGVEFEIEILNNIDGWAPLGVTARRVTPPRSCRAWITSRRSSVVQNIDFIVKRSPFTNASMVAGEDITVQLTDSDNGAWWLGARQPSGNAVRAGGHISGPEVGSRENASVRFTPPPGLEALLEPPYGVLQGDSLTMQYDGLPTNMAAGSQKLRDAEGNIDGVLSPGGGNLKVPELNRDDLSGPARKVRMPNGELVFRSTTGDQGQTVHVLEGDGRVLASYDPLAGNANKRFYAFTDTSAEGSAVIDLEARVMAVAENTELQVGDRAFRLRSVNASGMADSARQPTLYLGSADKGAAVDAYDIDIDGSVGGRGALKSQGNLKIAAKSYLSTTPDFGIALHAQEDIVLTKPGNSSKDGLAVDWVAFAAGYDKGSTATNLNLDRWARLGEAARTSQAASFQDRSLAGSGNADEFDAIWNGLTADFPADSAALAARNEWLRDAVPAVMGPDPSWTPAPPPAPTAPPTPADPTDPTAPVTGAPTDPADPPYDPGTAPIIELEPGIPAGPGISVEKYVRLREYLRTVKAGQPDPTWLNSSDPAIQAQRSRDITNLVRDQLSAYQMAAGQTSREVNGEVVLDWNTLGDYFKPTNGNPYLASYTPDMVFRGLIYAGRDFIFDTERKGVYVEGALVAKRDVQIKNATGANFVYNSELLENLFATDEEDTSAPLERTYWAFY